MTTISGHNETYGNKVMISISYNTPRSNQGALGSGIKVRLSGPTFIPTSSVRRRCSVVPVRSFAMGKLILCIFVVTRVLLFAFVTVFICHPFLSVLLVVPCMLSVLLVSGLAVAAAQSCGGAGSPHRVLKEDLLLKVVIRTGG